MKNKNNKNYTYKNIYNVKMLHFYEEKKSITNIKNTYLKYKM